METNAEYNPYYRMDDEIADDLLDQFTRDSRIDDVDIEIEVHEGEVTLRGTAESATEAEAAESIAQRTEGVIDVINELYVVESSHTQAASPGRDTEPEDELEGIEPLPGEREATEDYIDAVEQGLSYIPPDHPEFPIERNSADEVRRREVAEARSRERRHLRKGQSKKVEGQEK